VCLSVLPAQRLHCRTIELVHTTELFQSIDVWQRRGETELVRYRCFQSLTSGRYSVQSRDSYHRPASEPGDDTQFLELLLDASPDARAGAYESLAEAIRAHEQAFQAGD
jgi:hypothetical protein